MLVPSMKYFWFLSVDLTVVLDDTPADRKFGAEIATRFPFPKICFEKKFDGKYYHHDRKTFSQLSNFYADNCFNKTYVGFIDTDTFFVTPVTPELLFNGTRPHINCVFGYTYMKNWIIRALKALKKKEVFNFMTYFPVVVKLDHIVKMRQHMAKLHNNTFLEVFQNFSKNLTDFSQFSIMGNYIWYFHRDEYQFHAQYHKPGYYWKEDELTLSMKYYDVNVAPDMKKPFPASSVHIRHQYERRRTTLQFLKPGICISGGFHLCPHICDPKKQNLLHTDLFKFELQKWTWDQRCHEVQAEHYRNVIENYSEIIKPQILQGCQFLTKETSGK